MRANYRCYILTYNLINVEIASLTQPEALKVDPLTMLKTRGGFQFHSYVTPFGRCFEKQKLYRSQINSQARKHRRL